MADVIKCDRCGAINERKSKSLIEVKRTNKATICHKWSILGWVNTITYDLCDECASDLRDWMTKERECQ